MIFTTAYFPTAGLTYSWTPVSSSFYQSLPYTQNFESAWQNMTSVGDVPAANGVLTMPGTGNGSVRASDVTTANSVWSGTSGSLRWEQLKVVEVQDFIRLIMIMQLLQTVYQVKGIWIFI
jgi:hypothetical protein